MSVHKVIMIDWYEPDLSVTYQLETVEMSSQLSSYDYIGHSRGRHMHFCRSRQKSIMPPLLQAYHNDNNTQMPICHT